MPHTTLMHATDEVRSALEAGAHECINKPINLEALLEKLALSSQSDAVSS